MTFKRRQEHTRESKNSPATGNDTINVAKKKKKYDISKVIYFNYNRKGHYASDCTEPKNERQS